ncbi:glycosyltransferase [Methylobacterium oryzihabitans]|uniref:Glycosyltransferase n=1 Tax=Methylobacterium oryzihabitans TaxID=2499852 RepID=A0A437P155_9HYPH|nr:glycosyltransferase [Methylobacterium oryzihabitans]RVU15950.1 glycosyltransferase [Methylobacterium oryzihabitans]
MPAPARPTVSVLMSTYARETAAHLEASLASLWAQTLPPDQVVLVVDGPVGADQETVLARYGALPPGPVLTLVRLPRNRGLAEALNAGLVHCTGAFVARMDSDDLCLPDRIELQSHVAVQDPSLDLICSWNDEFVEEDGPARLKVAPVTHEALVQALKWRNVIQHSTVFVRAATLRAVGGYRATYGLLEDYDLFVRLALAGARFRVIPKVLVRIRTSLDQRRRRGGWRYCRDEIRFRRHLLRTGFLSAGEFVVVTALYAAFRLVSGRTRERLYAFART